MYYVTTKNYLIPIMLSLVFFFILSGTAECREKIHIYAANWNLENLFDTKDDPVKDDAEFLPSAKQEWTQERLEKKCENLARVIRSMNDWRGPDILGVEEVENREILDFFVSNFLKEKFYKIAYAESPDNRGIDVALVYNADLFSFLSLSADTVILPDKYPTRLILTVNLLTRNNDTLHIIVNHWPSRRGGESESEQNRLAAAEIAKRAAERHLESNQNANILLLGDFNDEPTNASIEKVLGAKLLECNSVTGNSAPFFYNLAYQKTVNGEGSYLYREDWNMLDQIIISNGLADNYTCGSFQVYKPEFMVTRSGKFKGAAFPTYGSGRYLGGYSDHFPVTAQFEL